MRAFRIAYDGRPFHGFQRQPDVPTVEDTLFEALRELSVIDGDADKPPGYAAAGRTDAGVSAVAQTVAFEAPGWLTPRALNSELPGSVRAWAVADVSDGFHATHDAASRSYRYYLYAPGSTDGGGTTTADFDDDRARRALSRLSGIHDFHNLTPDERGTERDLDLSGVREGRFFVVDATAGGFPRAFLRRLATLVRSVATGAASIDRIDHVLGEEPLTGPEGIPPAPPEPLLLRTVEYPGVAFDVDPEAAVRTREAFAERRRQGAVLDRVAGDVIDRIRE
ncbi:tRNA pseudouridine38-40 synthase [Halalkaliarchaeum desulfuricum]|uniref:tRNA pseudouridine synthase A n=1 Tax=Halalkaliarchaeum desulfuricum TaxID=2055893 RepID=A0A343TIN6_9EURY|nr:tRNA pseudouridine(38-40) synthase TruA [Halalkaliarchaeum desulfuricum]AUX08958.1 tRNA pseudouridine38-40 synthase [Halalkaliarchaeum desulfuricum]